MIAERKKRDDEWKQRQEARKKQEDERQKEWEQMQLAKLSQHPFKNEIDTCEHLIYYLSKNKKQG